MYGSKKCSRFNFGSAAKNIEHYGVPDPPSYNISNIRNAPVSIFWAENDWLADPQVCLLVTSFYLLY